MELFYKASALLEQPCTLGPQLFLLVEEQSNCSLVQTLLLRLGRTLEDSEYSSHV